MLQVPQSTQAEAAGVTQAAAAAGVTQAAAPAVAPPPVVASAASQRLLGRFGVLAVVGSVLLLVAICAGSIWAASRSADVLVAVQGMRRQRATVSDILIQAENAETAQRGYLLTNETSYLPALRQATEAMPGLLNSLSAAEPDPRYVILRQAVIAKLEEMAQTVRLNQAGDRADALALVRSNGGNQAMAAVRKLVAQFQGELDTRLVREVKTMFRDDQLVISIDLVGMVIIALLGWQTARAIRRYLARLNEAQTVANRANAELARGNERLDEMVRDRTADLVAANDEIQRFAYIVSHDLRAPLVNIMGFTSEMEHASSLVARHLVREGAAGELAQAATEDIPEALRFIRSSTSKMDRLINAILKLSREGRRVLVPEPVDMHALFTGLSETMRHQADSKQARIRIGELPDLTVDRLAVEQVFGNLVDNALKYLRPGVAGEISVGGGQNGGMVFFQVADNGRGIAARDRERVFELFRRAGDQTVPGEGIGLAHVRALVRRLGGTIDCSSELGVGTSFTVRLPKVALERREIAA